MIGRLHRFHGYTALGFVHKQGKVVRGSQLSLKYVLNQRRTTYRVAVVVSRKVDKSAVVRNRIRRRVYEITRELCADLKEPYDLAFTAYSNQLATMNAAELQTVVAEQLTRAGITPGRGIVKPESTRE